MFIKRKIVYCIFLGSFLFLVNFSIGQAADSFCCEEFRQGYDNWGEPATLYTCYNGQSLCASKGLTVVQGVCERIIQEEGRGERGMRCIAAFQSSGSTKSKTDDNPLKIKLNIKIPGLEEFSEGQGVQATELTFAKYLSGLYKFFVGIAGILAVFMIALGGVLWLFSGGSPDKISKAKETIIGAVAGLILALASYLVLYTINPDLVQFKALPIIKLEDQKCPSEKDVVDIQTYLSEKGYGDLPINISPNVSDPRAKPELIDKLANAAALLNEGDSLAVVSAYRSLAKQQELYDCARQKKETGTCPLSCSSCNEAAEPKCTSPHLTGQAIDVCLITPTVNTCNYLTVDCNDGACERAPDNLADLQEHLQEIMQEAGFSRYCGEWWHFESRVMSSPDVPGEYCDSSS
jgi:hypothetical protein